jgi:hypothetical protein
MNPDFLLELLNGSAAVLNAVFVYWLVRYLIIETSRRKIPLRDWMAKIPPAMHFATAIVVFDIGVFVRASTMWAWRHFYGGGQFNLPLLAFLAIGSFLIAVGAICKIRAITHPDHGDGPWLFAVGAAFVFVVASVLFR